MGDAVSMAEGGITRSKGTNLPIASVRNTVEESLFLTRVCRLTYMVENKRPCVHLSQQWLNRSPDLRTEALFSHQSWMKRT